MGIQDIKELVVAKNKNGVAQVNWSEIEPLLEESVDYPDKKKRFKMKLKPVLAEMGLDFNMVGDTIRFIVSIPTEPTMISRPKEITTPVVESINYLDYADDNPGIGTDFGHEYIFPSEFEFVRHALEDEFCFPLLVGDASSGKSRMCEEIAKRLDRHDWNGNVIGKGRPIHRMNMEEIEESADFVGTPQLVTNPDTHSSETVFIPGPLLEGWIKGWVIILDEIDRSSKAARKQLNAITEVGGKLMVPTHKGFKFFKKHPDTRLIFTANTWGHGDFKGMYDGAEPLNTAWLSRIGPKFEVKTDWSVFQEVLKSYGLPERVLFLLFQKDKGTVQTMQTTIRESNLQENLTLRSLIRFARCYKKFGWHFGLETCVINEFKEHNREKMRMVISKICGNDFKPRTNFDSIVNGNSTIHGIRSEQVQTALRQEGL
jgi:hypothetical protein